MHRVLLAPEPNLAGFAFLLNYPWEFLQVPFFAGMAEAAHWDAIVFCSRAAVGDVGIALLAFWVVAAMAGDRRWLLKPSIRQQVGFVSIGIIATISLEWLATEVWNRWTYAPSMPRLPLVGTGAIPLVQWLVLPPVLLWIVRRQILGSAPDQGAS